MPLSGSRQFFSSEVVANMASAENEDILNDILSTHFHRMISALGSGLVVIDTRNHGWLKNRKPDLTVLPEGFWETRPTVFQRRERVGVPANARVWDTIRSIIEVKMWIDNAARGQAVEYAQRMGGNLHVLLVDRDARHEGFRFEGGKVVSFMQGNLAEEGNADGMRQFLCRSEDKVANHVVDFASAVESFALQISSGQAFLGCGGSAFVYRAQQNGATVALKVFSSSNAPDGRAETNNIARLSPALGLPSVILEGSLETGAFAFMTSGVGQAVEVPDHIPEVFASLSAMHRSGWVHGDARTSNFIFVQDVVRPIDFVHARPFNGGNVAGAASDIFRLSSSILGLRGSNDLEQDPSSLVFQHSTTLHTCLLVAFEEYAKENTFLEENIRHISTLLVDHLAKKRA